MAQIIVSVQMVLEEKFVYTHDVHPLRAVGTEGTAVLSSCLQQLEMSCCVSSQTCTNKMIQIPELSVFIVCK